MDELYDRDYGIVWRTTPDKVRALSSRELRCILNDIILVRDDMAELSSIVKKELNKRGEDGLEND